MYGQKRAYKIRMRFYESAKWSVSNDSDQYYLHNS